MIGLDTNVLARAVTQDDVRHSPIARRLVGGLSEAAPGVINSVVLAEFAWVLRTKHKYGRVQILDAVEALMTSCAFLVRDRPAVNAALARCRSEPLDFADALIGELNIEAGCEVTVTFDTEAAESSLFRQLAP